MKQIMDQLRELEPGYYPNPEVCDELSNVNLAPMIGPAGTGKTTLLDYVVENYQDFGSSVGFTTRLPRDYESLDAYTFYDHSQETLERILGEVQDRSLVQFAVHPYTGFIYGSEIDSYKSQYNLIDIMASAVEPMRSLPFKSMNEIAVVCGVDDWQARFAPRLSDPDDAAKRIAEGVSSLEWLLDQGTDIAWLDTSNPDIVPKAEEFVGLAKGVIDPDPNVRVVGEQLLKHLKTL